MADEKNGSGDRLRQGLWAVNWSLVILLIFAGVILTAIIQDSQVLRRLEDPAYARGVITFLISLAAIGLTFMFVYQAFTDKTTSEDGFRRGREVLSGLMGIMGTIVGFYFGSTEKMGADHLDVAVTQEGVNLIAHAIGGTPPYRGVITFVPKDVKSIEDLQSKDGWLVVSLATVATATKATVELQDAKDVKSTKSIDLKSPSGSAASGSQDQAPKSATTPSPGPAEPSSQK